MCTSVFLVDSRNVESMKKKVLEALRNASIRYEQNGFSDSIDCTVNYCAGCYQTLEAFDLVDQVFDCKYKEFISFYP